MSKLGIIAGGGDLPRRLADACARDGRDFFVLGLQGQADKKFLQDVPHDWSRLGATNDAIKTLQKNNVDTLVMAGSVRRPSLVQMRPDWRTVKVFMKLGTRAFGDDALLCAISRELESEGFKIIGAHEVEPDIVTPAGVIGTIQPRAEQQKDIVIGVQAARELGKKDIGQACIVRQGVVIGTETAKGTDALIRQCQKTGSGGILVKCCKPQQDKRVDLPTIGARTIRKAYEAGLAGIAVEAGASIMLDRTEIAMTADELGLFVVGFES